MISRSLPEVTAGCAHGSLPLVAWWGLRNQFWLRRELSATPGPAQRLDELNARRHLLHSQIDGRLLIAQ